MNIFGFFLNKIRQINGERGQNDLKTEKQKLSIIELLEI